VQSLDDLLATGVAGKRVLVRSDLNVPLKDGVIGDDGRIKASIPTLRALASAGARVVVTAHLGRPKGKVDPAFSLAPVAARLGELLGTPVAFAADVVGSSAQETVAALKDGEIALLENVSTTRSAPCTASTPACTTWRSDSRTTRAASSSPSSRCSRS